MDKHSEDKKINTKDLPHEWHRTTTQQPEEFIDKEPNQKDQGDVPSRDKQNDVRREKGDQETA